MMAPGAVPATTADIGADIKKLLKKQEFPTVAIEAIGQLQKLLANFGGTSVPQQVCHRSGFIHLFFPQRLSIASGCQ